MKIVSWNVNGIRAAWNKGFGDWLAKSRADVVGIQEVRANESQIPSDLLQHKKWTSSFFPAERPGYSGVGLVMRERPDEIISGFGVSEFDVEGRIQSARFGKLLIVNGYFPNGTGPNRDLSRIPYKLRFYRQLLKWLSPELKAKKPILVMGDFNTAHTEIDLARPKENVENSGFRPEERDAFSEYLEAGFVDTFRAINKSAGHYTWWTQRGGARARNVGWRIDYILASPAAMALVKKAEIHSDVMGSDHCPISVEIKESAI